MGGEKFDTPHPEGYLFGENMDLNFLGNRPVQVRESWCFFTPEISTDLSKYSFECHFRNTFGKKKLQDNCHKMPIILLFISFHM